MNTFLFKNLLRSLLFVAISTATTFVRAQAKDQDMPAKAGQHVLVSVGINLPLGEFSTTHLIGAGVDCSPAANWFGLLKTKKIAFTYNGGAACYVGKKETASGYSYKYPGFIFIHALGGILYNPVKKASLSLLAGPALGIYNGNTRFNIGSKLEAAYLFSKKIRIGPGIIMMKEPGTNAIWSAALKTTMLL